SMVRAIARQAEAERERRAKIINAEGEQQAAQKLVDAARILAGSPQAMQLRYLNTLFDIASERSSLIVFPFPIELVQAFAGFAGRAAEDRGQNPTRRARYGTTNRAGPAVAFSLSDCIRRLPCAGGARHPPP